MGEIFGTLAGSLIWLWVSAKVVELLGKPPSSIWWGYGLTVFAAIVISQFTGFSVVGVAFYVFFGFCWAIFLARRAVRARGTAADASAEKVSPERAAYRRELAARSRTPSRSASPSSRRTRRTCRGCQTVNDSDADFCVRCGTSLKIIECATCETKNAANAQFCKRCGTQLDQHVRRGQVDHATSGPEKVPSPTPIAERKDFKCLDCGEYVSFGASHCKHCGLEFRYTGQSVMRAKPVE